MEPAQSFLETAQAYIGAGEGPGLLQAARMKFCKVRADFA